MQLRWFHMLLVILGSFVGLQAEKPLDSIHYLVRAYEQEPSTQKRYDIAASIMDACAAIRLEDLDGIRREKFDGKPSDISSIWASVYAHVYYYKNQQDSSLYYYILQRHLAEQENDLSSMVAANGNIAYILSDQGQYIDAIRQFRAYISVAFETGDERNVSDYYYNIASNFKYLNRLDSALVYFEKAASIDRSLENYSGMLYNLKAMANMHLLMENDAQTMRWCQACIDEGKKYQLMRPVAYCQYYLAEMYAKNQDWEQSIARINQAINMDIQRGDSSRLATFLLVRAKAESTTSYQQALKTVEQAVRLSKEAGKRRQWLQALQRLASIHMDHEQYGAAENMLNEIRAQWSQEGETQMKEAWYDLRIDLARKQKEWLLLDSLWKSKNMLSQEIFLASGRQHVSQIDNEAELFQLENKLEAQALSLEINRKKVQIRTSLLAILGLSVLVLGLLFYIVYARIRKRMYETDERNRQEQLEQHNALLVAQINHQKTKINPHFLFNGLNSINNFIINEDPRTASEYLSKFAMLMRHVLNHSSKQWVPVVEEFAMLRQYLEIEQIRFTQLFDFAFKIDDSIDDERIMIPTMLIQPFIENAIKHAFDDTIKNPMITIALKLHDSNMLALSVHDNGKGRQKRVVNTKSQHRSQGLLISEERLQMLNQLFDVKASMQVIDYTNPSGTEVLIRMKIISNDERN